MKKKFCSKSVVETDLGYWKFFYITGCRIVNIYIYEVAGLGGVYCKRRPTVMQYGVDWPGIVLQYFYCITT